MARIGANLVWEYNSRVAGKTIPVQGQRQLILSFDNPDMEYLAQGEKCPWCIEKLYCIADLHKSPTSKVCTLVSADLPQQTPKILPLDARDHATKTASVAVACRGTEQAGVAPLAGVVPVNLANSTAVPFTAEKLNGADGVEQAVLNATAGILWLLDNASDEILSHSILSSQTLVPLDKDISDPPHPNLSAALQNFERVLISITEKTAFIASAGNDKGLSIRNSGRLPGGHPNVVSVGSITQLNQRADISNIDPTLVAPGECIGRTELNGTVGASDGTSYAAPHVSGAVALISSYLLETFGVFGNVKGIVSAIRSHLENLGLSASDQGGGLVDVKATIDALDSKASQNPQLFKQMLEKLNHVELTDNEVDAGKKVLDSAKSFEEVQTYLEKLVEQKIFSE